MRLVGTIDAHALDEAANGLARTLAATRASNRGVTLLLDLREAVWDSEHTHMWARQMLGKHLHAFQDHQCVVAILTTAYDFHVSATEAFFTDEHAAWDWIRSIHQQMASGGT